MLKINEASIIGKIYTTPGLSSNTEWTCIGYASNDTFLVVGTSFDSTNNRSIIRTHKFKDVVFKDLLTPK